MPSSFKSDVKFEDRVKQASDIMIKYPDRIPVYVSKKKNHNMQILTNTSILYQKI